MYFLAVLRFDRRVVLPSLGQIKATCDHHIDHIGSTNIRRRSIVVSSGLWTAADSVSVLLHSTVRCHWWLYGDVLSKCCHYVALAAALQTCTLG